MPPPDRLADALAELYAGDPESFTVRRGELVAAARDAGDRAAAKAIGTLRRPTRVAWIVNTLARTSPDAPSRLASLGVALRDAQQAKDGRRLRELSAERGELIDSLTARALDLAEVADPPPALRLEVSQTLTAALADPGTAAEFAAGTLTRAVQWSGFGVLPAGGDEEADVADAAAAGQPTQARRPRLKAVPAEPAVKPSAPKAAPARPRASAGRHTDQGAEAEQRAERAERQAEEARQRAEDAAAERAAQQREQYATAEHAAAVAATAAAEAGAAEDRLEAEVRELEQRLTGARSELTAARLRARRAESAARRAEQARDRLAR